MPAVDICKTRKQIEQDAKFLNSGIGIKDIPNSAKKQRIGFNSKGITKVKSTKKNDPFRRENFF